MYPGSVFDVRDSDFHVKSSHFVAVSRHATRTAPKLNPAKIGTVRWMPDLKWDIRGTLNINVWRRAYHYLYVVRRTSAFRG